MLNQSLYYTIGLPYLEPNTKSEGVVTTPFVADVAKSSLVAWRLIYVFASPYFDHDASMHHALHEGLLDASAPW